MPRSRPSSQFPRKSPRCPLRSVVLLFSLLSARPSSRNRRFFILISLVMISAYNYALSILQSSEIEPLPSSHGKLARAIALAADSPLQQVGFLIFTLSFVFAATKQSGHAHLQISAAEAISIVCESAAVVSPQTLPTNKKLCAQVCPLYQSS